MRLRCLGSILRSPVLWAAPVGGVLVIGGGMSLLFGIMTLIAGILEGDELFVVPEASDTTMSLAGYLLPLLLVTVLPVGLLANLIVILIRKKGYVDWDWNACLLSSAIACLVPLAESLAWHPADAHLILLPAFCVGVTCHWIGNIYLGKRDLFQW